MDDLNLVRTLLVDRPAADLDRARARLRLQNAMLTGGVRRNSGAPLLRRLLIGPAVGTGILAAGLATVVLLGSGGAPAGRDSAPDAHGGAGTDQLSAQDILLAAAESAGRQPATSGRYWMTQVHSTSETAQPNLKADPSREGGYSPEEVAKLPKMTFAQDEVRTTWVAASAADDSFIGMAGRRTESWGEGEKDYDEWMNVTDPSANPPHTDLDTISFGGDAQLNLAEVRALPSSKSELEAALRAKVEKRCAARVVKPAYEEVIPACYSTPDTYARSTIMSLLVYAPMAPAQRSAAYQLLAELPWIEKVGRGEDSTGRSGVKLAWNKTEDNGDTSVGSMLIDEETGQMFWKSGEVHQPSQSSSSSGTMEVEKAEWTDATPTPPTPPAAR